MGTGSREELLRLLTAVKEPWDQPLAPLILADWLEEHGDLADRDRAAFVRLVSAVSAQQRRGPPSSYVPACELERAECVRRQLGRAGMANPAGRWDREVFQFWDRSLHEWCGPLSHKEAEVYWTWSDYGLMGMTTDAQSLLVLARAGVFEREAWAWVSAVTVRNRLSAPRAIDLALSDLLKRNVFAGLNRLAITCEMSAAAVRVLASSAGVSRLTMLRLPGGPLTDDAALALASSKSLRKDLALSFVDTSMTSAAQRALERAFPHLDLGNASY